MITKTKCVGSNKQKDKKSNLYTRLIFGYAEFPWAFR